MKRSSNFYLSWAIKSFTTLICFTVFLNSCQEKSFEKCLTILKLDQHISKGEIILLGEIHGTKEIPEYVQHIICGALKKQLNTVLFLELPLSDQSTIDAFLHSDGSDDEKKKIIQLPFWSKDFQDGRTSTAMFNLLENMRILISKGEKLQIVLIDQPKASDRDSFMANVITNTAKKSPNHFFISLTGNYHNIVNTPNSMGNIIQSYFPQKTYSLNFTHKGGSAWICSDKKCGAIERGAESVNNKIGIYSFSNLKNYDAFFQIDSIHASPPAKFLFN